MSSYADLIKDAIVALKDLGGSSRSAINKFVSAKKGSDFQSGVFNRAIKSGVEKGDVLPPLMPGLAPREMD